MQVVDPSDKTTLLLNRYHEPFSVCTARAALRHLMSARVIGFDADGAMYSWDGKHPDDPALPPSSINWKAKNIAVDTNQPILRSAPVGGHEVYWFIPLAVRCNRTFGYRSRGNRDISLKKCYSIYKGVCQYCWNKIPYSEATKDHYYPKSKGGSNQEFNILLACKSCNNKKGDQFPFLDCNGKKVVPKKPLPSGIFLPDNPRPEWGRYLLLDAASDVVLT